MTSEAWERKLCNLIRKFKSSSDVASFRNDYRDIIAKSDISKAKSDLLFLAREYLEAWLCPDLQEHTLAYDQWQKLYNTRTGKDGIPYSVLESLLRKLPNGKDAGHYWEEFLLGCKDKKLILALLQRRLVRNQYLNRLAKANPIAFYDSAALDVMVERSALKASRSLWDECIRGRSRATALLSSQQLLICFYSMSVGKKYDDWMLEILLNHPQNQDAILDTLLIESGPSIRFCLHLAFGHFANSEGGSQIRADRIHDLLITWARKCENVLEKETVTKSVTASCVLALIRLSSLSCTNTVGTGELANVVGKMTGEIARRLLRTIEVDRSSPTGGTILVLVGDELYESLQEYLQSLPVLTGTVGESPERTLRYGRYLGMKTLIEHILPAMDTSTEEGQLRDAIDVALFNCGLRPIGIVGEQIHFDVRSHQSETPGVRQGDSVIVMRPGLRFGDEVEGHVLRKATVRGIARTEST